MHEVDQRFVSLFSLLYLMNENNGIQEPLPSAAVLRDRAAHVRRLMAELVFEADKRVLREYAEELEERATEMERGGHYD